MLHKFSTKSYIRPRILILFLKLIEYELMTKAYVPPLGNLMLFYFKFSHSSQNQYIFSNLLHFHLHLQRFLTSNACSHNQEISYNETSRYVLKDNHINEFVLCELLNLNTSIDKPVQIMLYGYYIVKVNEWLTYPWNQAKQILPHIPVPSEKSKNISEFLYI